VILSFHCPRDLAQGIGGGRGESRDAHPLVDAAGQEARHASSVDTQTRQERERDRHAASQAVKRWGTEVLPRSVSSSEGDMEWGGIPVSPTYGSFLTSRRGSPADSVYDQRTMTEVPLS
jgi:hypothetical protein